MLKDFAEWWLETTQVHLFHGDPAVLPPHLVLRKGCVELPSGEFDYTFSDEIENWDGDIKCKIQGALNCRPVLALDASRYILRTLSPLRLPHSRARSMLDLDLAAMTPFKTEDVYCFLLSPINGSRPFATTYAIVKRTLIDPLIRTLQSINIPPSRIVLLQPDEEQDPAWQVNQRDIGGLIDMHPQQKRMTRVMAFLVAALSLGTVLNLQWTFASAHNKAQESIPVLEAQARQVRDELNKRASRIAEIDALRRTLATQRPISEVLEELSRVLPDSAYLTDLSIEGDHASLVGFSSSASSTIAPIESSPMFEDAEFTAPVIKTPGREGERFEVTLKVRNR